ncbi:hypothetical protein Goklo_015829 [Gossypium klotzschianum]|uniref:RNase H type-1 domain-containing protein n=2 Tax=Gossypium TaxID=3633 RepID=A0A7J8UC43_9ROSI|nr:hypothetical protein [Gossypium klotzschianum]
MGDSKMVIKKCQSFITDRLVIGAIIRDIQNRKNSYQEIEFSFIPKAKTSMLTLLQRRLSREEKAFT